jgi:hypothetical protein
MEPLHIVEGVESVWHYHLSETGLNGKPALCGRKEVMLMRDSGISVPGLCPSCEKFMGPCTKPGVLKCFNFKSN